MSNYQQMKKTSALSGGSASFVEDLYESYLTDPQSVPENWQVYFADWRAAEAASAEVKEIPRLVIQDKFAILSKLPKTGGGSSDASVKQTQVDSLIGAYRNSGHKAADIDPLRFRDRDTVKDLDYRYHGLTDADLDENFATGTLFTDKPQMKLRERYLHTRYVGQKRFSLEGGDSLIPMMDRLIQRLGSNGAKEVVIGMAHRGRLNVLINIMGKLPEQLFEEFEGRSVKAHTAGDVKYHLGFSSDVETPGGDLHLSLAFNPSHLEIVNPVVQGSVRARMERRKPTKGAGTAMAVASQVVPIQIHGDAAFANQGVIQETLQLSQVRGYRVGGTVHVIINNQIGFTTSNLQDARSSLYCSDPAKIVEAPVLHVNGDDPEAVAMVAEIAADYIFQYHKDIVLDLVCYRRLGHNEADEPATTQPMMYKNIRARKTTLALYADCLIGQGIIKAADIEALKTQYKDTLDAGISVSRRIPSSNKVNEAKAAWEKYATVDWQAPVDTTYAKDELTALAQKLFSYPDTFKPHRIVQKLYEARQQMALNKVIRCAYRVKTAAAVRLPTVMP